MTRLKWGQSCCSKPMLLLIRDRDGHGSGSGFKSVDPDPNPGNPDPCPRVDGLVTQTRGFGSGKLPTRDPYPADPTRKPGGSTRTRVLPYPQTPRQLEARKLGRALLRRYCHWEVGELNILGAAVEKFQEVVNLTSEGHPDRGSRTDAASDLGRIIGTVLRVNGMHELCGTELKLDQTPETLTQLEDHTLVLLKRNWEVGDLNGLGAAMEKFQEPVNLTVERPLDRAGLPQDLAGCFKEQYQISGDPNDLKAVVEKFQEALDLTPERHPDWAGHLQGLGLCLGDYQYKRVGDLNDLEAAVEKFQEVVNLTPEGHTERFQKETLVEAVEQYQEAVNLTPDWHPDKAGLLQGISVSFIEQYHRLGELKDLQTGVQNMKETVDRIPAWHPERTGIGYQEAVDLTSDGHPKRASRLQGLAATFTLIKYRHLGDLKDLKAASERYQEAVDLTPEGHPEKAVRKDREFGSYAYSLYRFLQNLNFNSRVLLASVAEEFNSLNCITAYTKAFHLLSDILWIGNELRAYFGSRNYGTGPIGIIFQQMLQLRTDLDGLLPDQANKLQSLSSELYSGTSLTRDTAIKRQDLLKEIRLQPDLNSTSDPVHLPLPEVTLDILKSQQEILRQLLACCNVRKRDSASNRLFGCHELYGTKPREEKIADLLSWFFTHIVALSIKHEIYNGKIWWLPTGGFTGLPLHASLPTNQFIHSYTATLGSLLDAYAKKASTALKIGIVGVADTGNGSNYLPGAKKEVKTICSIIKNLPVESLDGKKATVDAAKHQLQNCPWVHLACHGKQDLIESTKSHLMLYEGNLELESILQMPLSNAEFVFLAAACQTAMGDSELIYESFHLGGGFIVAGFRGAIVSMWSMPDQDGPLVAELVYSHLFQEGRQPQARTAAEALQLAVMELKARKVSHECWIPFIHMGIYSSLRNLGHVFRHLRAHFLLYHQFILCLIPEIIDSSFLRALLPGQAILVLAAPNLATGTSEGTGNKSAIAIIKVCRYDRSPTMLEAVLGSEAYIERVAALRVRAPVPWLPLVKPIGRESEEKATCYKSPRGVTCASF
ncbi:CHAT domain-containing protein [Mycena pura]|uniref:CHAT domain-containing protein n=1 Tax=Mycena pura TaxID=153505 RepID=A0AAD6URJ9_9AGAR|nr:CHAT domain-containing protein [Mycena pura]